MTQCKATKIIIILLSALLVILLTSCFAEGSAEDLLFEITKEIESLPDGTVYLSSAKEGSKNHMDESIIKNLYHESAYDYEFTLIEEFAVYVSYSKPQEIAVYKCYSRSDTDIIASMCLSRIEKLSVLLAETSFCDIPKNAVVKIHGRFVTVTML